MEQVLGADQCGRWETVFDALPPVRDGWLYHGTSLQAALAIMTNGFATHGAARSRTGHPDVLGSVAAACDFAARPTIVGRGPPAILQARVDDVAASGKAMPMITDDNCDVDHADWRTSLASCQSPWVLGGRYVRGLALHTI